MTIFEPLYEQLPKFSDYMDYYKEEKEGHVISSMKLSDRVLVIDEAMPELFWPTKKCNSETTQYCYVLANGIATTLLIELEDTSKATFEYLSAAGGKHSQAVIDCSEEMATLGMRANNNPSEGTFATFTDILCGAGRINLSSASAIGHMRYNNDMVLCHEQFISGRRSKSEPEAIKLGTFHLLPVKLQDSLLPMCKKGSRHACKEFDEALQCQRQCNAEKAKLIAEQKLEKAEEHYIDVCYYFQQYNSPRCWNTSSKARREYNRLTQRKISYILLRNRSNITIWGWVGKRLITLGPVKDVITIMMSFLLTWLELLYHCN